MNIISTPITRRGLFAILAMLLLCGMVFPAGATPPTTRKQLINSLNAALKEHAPEAIEALYYWNNVPGDIRQLHREMFVTLTETPIEKVEFAPFSKDYETEIVENGREYRVNLPLKGLVRIQLYDDILEKRGFITIPYGQVGAFFYLAGIERTLDGVPSSTYNVYTISVQGLLFPEPVAFKGIYMYEKDGKTIKKKFIKSGFFKETIQADKLLACIVKKVSAHGWIKAGIRRNGVDIFTAKETDSTDAIIYKLK